MGSERMKRCTNAACKANAGTRRGFSADLTTCPLCGSSLRFINPPCAVGKGSGKGGGKSSGQKGLRVSGGSAVARKLRKKKSPKKWPLHKDLPRKDVGRKR
jgi:hypothetical protein